MSRKPIFDVIRIARGKGFTADEVPLIDTLLDRLQVPRGLMEGATPSAVLSADRTGPLISVRDLQARLKVTQDGVFGSTTKAALFVRLSNKKAPALTDADFAHVAADLEVDEKIIRAVRKVEAPRGPFDDVGRPSILYERHVFARNSGNRFNKLRPHLSGPPYGPGGYGAFSAQYDKLAAACALDPEAAFRACSWGAFQVLGENAQALGYASAFDMALALKESEAAHLDSFVRFVRTNDLLPLLRMCRAGDPASCEPFVAGYNGPGYRRFSYHVKLAEAAQQ